MYTHASVDDLDIFYHIITDSLEICDSFFLDPLSRGHDGYPGRIGGQVLGANPPGGGVQGQRFPAGEQGLPGRQDRLRRRGRRDDCQTPKKLIAKTANTLKNIFSLI